MADEVWIDILPSMRGFGGELAKEATKAAKTAGTKAGKGFKGEFVDGADGSGDALVKELEGAQKRAAGLVAKLSGEVSRARQAQSTASAGLLTSEQRVTDALEKYGEESKQARAATLKLEAAQEKAKQASQKFETSQDALRESQKGLKETTGQLETATEKSGTEAKKTKGFWEQLTGAQKDSAAESDNNAESLGKMATKLAAAAGGVALLVEAFQSEMGMEVAADKLNAALGSTPKQAETYGKAAGELYANAYGDSMDDVTRSVDSVVSSIAGMRDASSADIEDITGKAMSLAAAFDIDVGEAARNAGILIENGLAKDATDAFDLMTASMQQVPAALRGEVMDATQEYSKSFSQLGIDGPAAMGLLVASTANGQYGIDKMGDAVKELTIRSTDMSATSVEAYEAAGLSATDMSAAFLAGGDTAAGALDNLVVGLQNIKDPTEQANAAIALFGTPLEDLGTDKIPAFIDQLGSMDGSLGDVTGAAGALDTTLNDNATITLETLKRGFMDTLRDGVKPLLGYLTGTAIPTLQTFGGWLVDNKTWLLGIASAVGGATTAFYLWKGAIAAWQMATKIAIAVQTAYNAVLAANPIGIVVIAIAALVAGLVYFFTQTEVGQKAWEVFTNALATAWEWVSGVFSDVWENVLKPVWDAVAGAAVWLWDTILKPTFEAITTAWAFLADGFSWYWDNILQPVFNAVAAVAGWLWGNMLSIVFTNIERGWSVLTAAFGLVWRNVLKPVFEAVGAVASWLWDTAIKPAWEAMKTGWDTLVGGITSVWENQLKPAFETMKTFVSETIPGAFETAKDAIGTSWDKIRDLAAKPINFVIETVYNNGLRKAVNKVLDFVGGTPLPLMSTIPAYAEGGLHRGGWALVGEEGPELVDFTNPGQIYTATDTQAMMAGEQQAPTASLGAFDGTSMANAAMPVGGIGDWVSSAADTVKGVVGDAVKWVRGGLAKAAAAILDPVRTSLRAVLPEQGIADIARQAAEGGIDDALAWIAGIDEADKAAGNATYTGTQSGSMTRPSYGPVTSGFGQRWGRLHAGVDIAGGGNTYAAANGLVQSIGSGGPGGINMLLNHGPDLWSYYAHNPSMAALGAGVGDEVKAGQRIGQQGATGNATGVHLHFEVRDGTQGNAVDPAGFIKYDNGGILQPGSTSAMNATGRPEYVFTEPQWQVIERAATTGHVGAVDLTDATIDQLAETIATHLGLVGEAARNVKSAVTKARTLERMG